LRQDNARMQRDEDQSAITRKKYPPGLRDLSSRGKLPCGTR
jgi:hypothetical protein